MRQNQKNAWQKSLQLTRNTLSLLLKGLWFGASSLVIESLVLPYQIFRVFFPRKVRGRPASHPISKFFRKAFESKKTKRLAGVGLTVVLMLSGLVSNIAAANQIATAEGVVINVPEISVVTEASLQQPLVGVLAQRFSAFHRGVDILSPLGTEIRPIAKGKVIEASFSRIGWGNTVVLEHENGLSSRYAHLKDIKVIEGDEIDKDFVLGTVGMTGWTTGSHLHLEIYQNSRAIDPLTVLPSF